MQSPIFRKGHRMLARIALAVALTAFTGMRAAQAQTEAGHTYVVLGTSAVHNDDTANAGKHATADSLISAIGLAVNELMPAGLAVDHFTALKNIVYDKSDQFILNYKVLAETRSDKKVLALVRVTVAFDKIREHLQRAGLAVDRTDLPRVLFLISERTAVDDMARYWWSSAEGAPDTVEKEMRAPFASRGYPIVNHAGLPAAGEGEAVPPNPEPDNEAVARIGRMFNADIVIAGSAVAEKTLNQMGEEMHTFKATVNARAVKVESGEAAASATYSDVRLHAEEETGIALAIHGAAVQAAEDLARQLSGVWLESHQEQPTHVSIIVKGTSDLAGFVKLRERITALPGVNQVKVVELRADQAVLSVDFQFGARRLAKDLMLQTFDSFGIDIADIAEDGMRITLNPR